MDILLLSIGKISTPWIKEGIEIFESRIQKYINFTAYPLPDIKTSKSFTKERQKEEEGKLILNQISTSDFVVLMDEKGKEYTSRAFAEWIQKQMNTGRKRLVFIIGGPFGFSEAVYSRADAFIALSKMTLTHEMAKVFLTEQLYRALTIIKGEQYHHD